MNAQRATQGGETARLAGAGLTLTASCFGDSGASPVLLLHGGGQTRRAWKGTGQALADGGWYALSVDLRGHGESDWAADGNYRIDAFADDVRALAWGFDEPVVLVGASLGGLASLIAAGDGAGLSVRGLILVDVAHRAPVAGVDRIIRFMRAAPEGFGSLEEAADAVARYLPHRPRPGPEALSGLRANLRERDGRLVWHWDPRLLDVLPGDGLAAPSERLLSAAQRIQAPIMLVRGASSDVVSEDIAKEFVEAVPGAELAQVEGARHMIAGDQNDPFLVAVGPFLRQLRRQP